MDSRMVLSFQLKKSGADSHSKASLYARITVNGLRTEFSLKRQADPAKWSGSIGVVKGNSEESKSVNAFLVTVRSKINEHYRELLELKKLVTPEAIKNAYLGVQEKGKTLCEVFEYHNVQVKSLVGQEYAEGTFERYTTALSHLKQFMARKYAVSDIEVKSVSYEFLTEYEFFLKTVRKCSHNTAMKYITNFKKIIRICIGNGWIERDPFTNYKHSLREIERGFLSQEDLNTIATKEFATPRLSQVRDIFLFCCYTGLAYSDVKKLSKDHIITGIDGEKWIKINRTKTDTRSSIPLLQAALEILEKYSKHEICVAKNQLLPVLTNQKMNSYLKEIGDVCGINKNITCHLARHTFATTVTLTNGVPLESVSRMLGHRSIKTTQHYAKIIDQKVSEDMRRLKERFSNIQNPSKSAKKIG